MDEAKQILNINELDKEKIQEKYDVIYNLNDKTKGGSFYIQSKVKFLIQYLHVLQFELICK